DAVLAQQRRDLGVERGPAARAVRLGQVDLDELEPAGQHHGHGVDAARELGRDPVSLELDDAVGLHGDDGCDPARRRNALASAAGARRIAGVSARATRSFACVLALAAGARAQAPAKTDDEPRVRWEALDNGGFEEPPPEFADGKGVRRVPWWRTTRGAEQLV